MELQQMYQSLGIDEDIFRIGESTAAALADRFAEIERTAEICQMKVVAAMQKNPREHRVL